MDTMKRRYTLWMIVGLMMAALSGCTSRATMDKLEYLEARMAVDADSVRNALAAIDGSRLHGEARALHALLYSQAMDKCYIDVVDDSLINIAVNFYREDNDIERRFASLYYLGRIFYNKGDKKQAINVYTEAELYAEQVSNHYMVGLLYSHISGMYTEEYDYLKALNYSFVALEHYRKAGHERLQHSELRDIGYIYENMNQFDDAENYLKLSMNWAYQRQDKRLCASCVYYLLNLYDAWEMTDKFFDLYNSSIYLFCNDQINADSFLARQYALIGQSDKAKLFLEQAWEQTRNMNDTIALYGLSVDIFKILGKIDEALLYKEKQSLLKDSLLRLTLQQPLITSQRDFYHDQNELNEIKLQKSRQTMFFICVVGILTIALIIIVARARAKKKREELEDYMNLNEELKRTVYSKEETISTMGKRLGHLLRGRYELLNELTNTYYEANESQASKERVKEVKENSEKMNEKKADAKKSEKSEDNKESREAIYKKVKTAIDRMAGDRKVMQELESIVNDCCNNVMHHLHDELPELPYDDTVLLCYIYAGFSAKAIHTFTKNSISNIYSRKSRLREHIRQSGVPHSQLLLDMMP